MANLIPQQQPLRGNLLIEGTVGVNVTGFVNSIVGAALWRATLPRCLFLVDDETEGRDQVRNMQHWLDGYGAAQSAKSRINTAKHNCIGFHKNTLAMKPVALANYLLEVEPAVHPFFVVRDQANEPNDPNRATWHTYGSAINERIKATIIHAVKRTSMGVLPVETANYAGHWEITEHHVSGQQRDNSPIVVLDHATGKSQLWKDRPVAGGPSIYWPDFSSEAVHA